MGDEEQVVGLHLPNCDHFADCLVRLPLFYELTDEEVSRILDSCHSFFNTLTTD